MESAKAVVGQIEAEAHGDAHQVQGAAGESGDRTPRANSLVLDVVDCAHDCEHARCLAFHAQVAVHDELDERTSKRDVNDLHPSAADVALPSISSQPTAVAPLREAPPAQVTVALTGRVEQHSSQVIEEGGTTRQMAVAASSNTRSTVPMRISEIDDRRVDPMSQEVDQTPKDFWDMTMGDGDGVHTQPPAQANSGHQPPPMARPGPALPLCLKPVNNDQTATPQWHTGATFSRRSSRRHEKQQQLLPAAWRASQRGGIESQAASEPSPTF
jgi:hypothetical protein